ncbi:hypothetical protein FOA52_009611 [Chlamydomonas sp. UWO 241]|nr:hypothetical protein FOA52_009611 [Chlamydomonas sp. UWO 241]
MRAYMRHAGHAAQPRSTAAAARRQALQPALHAPTHTHTTALGRHASTTGRPPQAGRTTTTAAAKRGGSSGGSSGLPDLGWVPPENSDRFSLPRRRGSCALVPACGRTVVAVSWGGFASVERVRILLGQAEVMASVREDPASSGAMVALQVKGNFMFDPAKHPDFLGAVLGTGVVRAKVGDVLVQGESGAQILVVPDMMEHFESALVQVRTVPVEARAIGLEQLQVRAPKMEEVCSFKMADMVKAGDVRVNWRPVTKASIELKAGDVVAVAGKGRVEVKEVSMTKKERYIVTLMRYV